MDELSTLFGFSPEHAMAVLGAVFTILLALRTFLRALIVFLRVIDLALDGRYDWTWVGAMSDGLDWADRNIFDRLPVKLPLLKSGGK